MSSPSVVFHFNHMKPDLYLPYEVLVCTPGTADERTLPFSPFTACRQNRKNMFVIHMKNLLSPFLAVSAKVFYISLLVSDRLLTNTYSSRPHYPISSRITFPFYTQSVRHRLCTPVTNQCFNEERRMSLKYYAHI